MQIDGDVVAELDKLRLGQRLALLQILLQPFVAIHEDLCKLQQLVLEDGRLVLAEDVEDVADDDFVVGCALRQSGHYS